ncbi:MAG TPA: hypothetical protein VHY20_11480 [Pirellulales bacterium]|jgi:hypothetical protein|nr:hypothetical protein [Pirellulales bacterium]
MAKKKAVARRSSGTASIQTVEDDQHVGRPAAEEAHEARADEMPAIQSNGKAERKPKAKAEPQANGSFGVGEIRKAAQFANSIGGLDKAIALLQILKVAKEVQ